MSPEKLKKLKVQLNHPGGQKAFLKSKNGFFEVKNKIYREWNNDDTHYRKFMTCKGTFIEGLFDTEPKDGTLFFWGEWEGYSEFTPFKSQKNIFLPNGIHKPIYSKHFQKGKQNTDPYIFGKNFKYAICKQKGELQKLDKGSIILFGSTYPSKNIFVIDTVFIVKTHEKAEDIAKSNAKNLSKVYIESTLKQLDEAYLGEISLKRKNKLYQSLSWWDNNDYFSFVPCKLEMGDNGFERLKIDLNQFKEFSLSSNATGKSFLKNCNLEVEEIWAKISEEAKKQGFVLGLKFEEPIEEIIKFPHNSEWDNLSKTKSC